MADVPFARVVGNPQPIAAHARHQSRADDASSAPERADTHHRRHRSPDGGARRAFLEIDRAKGSSGLEAPQWSNHCASLRTGRQRDGHQKTDRETNQPAGLTKRRTAHASSVMMPDTAMIVGLVGMSNGIESEKPTTAATSALPIAQRNIPPIVDDSSSPVTAGSTRKSKTSITPANCIATAMTTPSDRYNSWFHRPMR